MSLTKKILRRLKRDERGSILVEIALTVPLFLSLLTGAVEVGNYILLHLKLQHTVVSIADLVTRDEEISETVMADIFQAVPQIMAPYDSAANGVMIVSAISQTEDDPASVYWQRAGGGTLEANSQYGAEGDVVAEVDVITLRDDETILVTEIYYAYEPLFFEFLPEATLSRTAFFRPRIGSLQEMLNE